MSGKLSYNNVSKGAPRLGRDPKNEEQVFFEELRLQHRTNKKLPALIYRTGQAPSWVGDEEEQDVDLLARKKGIRHLDRKGVKTQIGLATTERPLPKPKREVYTAQVVKEGDGDEDDEEPEEHEENEEEEDKEAEPAFRDFKVMKIDVTKLEVQGEPSSDEDNKEDELSSRRARARLKNLKKAEEEKAEETKAELEDEKKDEDAKEEEESEYETDSEEEESEDDYASSRPLLKPVYVSKKDRETVAEKKRKEEDEKEAVEALEKRKKQRKKESKRLVAEVKKREDELKKHGAIEIDGEEELPDDDDDVNEEEEREKWKIRELRRLKTQKEEDDKHDSELADTERRRNMTDTQIMAENKLNPRMRRLKGTMRYLQKYYHPGGFFQDDDERGLRLQNFSQPTGADRVIDRTLLPKVMQVKKFGLKGRVKWTHLTHEDTSGYAYRPPGAPLPTKEDPPAPVDNPWLSIAKDPELSKKIVSKHKLGGVGSGFSRPTAKKPKTSKT